MNSHGVERIVRQAAMAIAVLAGIGALLAGGYLEITFLMVAGVTASLICFDTAMERGLQSFALWGLLSLAPILKTVPTVWAELRSESGLLVERYDHTGSLLFGICVFAVVVILARPADRLGPSAGTFVAAVIAGSAVTGALAGASVAFLFDSRFGSTTAARLLETPTWFVLSGILAASVIAASQARALSFALTGVLASSSAAAGLLAVSVAGRDIDAGWWALLFAGLAVSAAGTDGLFGELSSRDRRSNIAVTIALVVGLIAAASAIAARSDRTAWAPGWALLGVMSLAMFALAMASKPVDQQAQERTAGSLRATAAGDEDERASRARARATQSLDLDTHGDATLSPGQSIEEFADQLDPQPPRSDVSAPRVVRTVSEPDVPMPRSGGDPIRNVDGSLSEDDEPSNSGVSALQSDRDDSRSAASPPMPEIVDEDRSRPVVPATPRPGEQTTRALPGISPTPQPVREQLPRPEMQSMHEPVAHAQSANPQQPAEDPATSAPQPEMSDASIVASAQAAAAVRTAPQTQRHSLAPLAQAHHFDPSTGLLSSAGLQHAIARAFDVPRRAGHVTMLMFMVRDLDRIEQDHGRLASAAVTGEVADRIGSLLPQGTGARFARSAYAVVFLGDLSNVTNTTQWLARVLLQLRAPVEGGSLGDKIDVVAGMAQCYEGEDAAQFVKRANLGLARAVQLAEPTLVAMP